MSFLSWNKVLTHFPHVTRLLEPTYVPIRNYAARKGTRDRKQKKKVKKEVEVAPKFIPHNIKKRELLLTQRATLKVDDSWKALPQDDVYVMRYFKEVVYPFQEAVKCHRETHHPDMYNEPGAPLIARIELNMQGEKATRFIDDFKKIVAIPYPFEHGEERSVIAFSKDVGVQREALDKGAQLAGGPELIKQIQGGTVSLHDFQFIIAHPDILPELVPLRGIMKRRFPNTKAGTLDIDLGVITERFIRGLSYQAKKDEYEKDFGLIETILGDLTTKSQHLEDNFKALIQDVHSMKPKRSGSFITRCLLVSPPSREKLKVNHQIYLEEKEDEEEEKAGERVAL